MIHIFEASEFRFPLKMNDFGVAVPNWSIIQFTVSNNEYVWTLRKKWSRMFDK